MGRAATKELRALGEHYSMPWPVKLVRAVVPPMPMWCAVVPHIPTVPIWGTRCYPYWWERATTLRAQGVATATSNVHRVLAPECHAMCPPLGSGSPSACSCRHDCPALARNWKTYVTFILRLYQPKKKTQKTQKIMLHKNCRIAYGRWGGQQCKPCTHWATTTACPGPQSQCVL